MTSELAWVPQSCTLPSAQQPLRVAEFDGLLSEHLAGAHRPDPTHLVLRLHRRPGVAARTADLADRESSCCGFFTFVLTVADPLVLEITVDAAHVGVLDALEQRTAAGA